MTARASMLISIQGAPSAMCGEVVAILLRELVARGSAAEVSRFKSTVCRRA